MVMFHSYVSLPADTVDPISLKHGHRGILSLDVFPGGLDGLPHPGTARARACFLGNNLLRDQAPGSVTREKTHHKYAGTFWWKSTGFTILQHHWLYSSSCLFLPEGIWQLQVTGTKTNLLSPSQMAPLREVLVDVQRHISVHTLWWTNIAIENGHL